MMKRCLMLDVDGVLVKGRPKDGLPWATDIEKDLGINPARLQAEFFTPYWADIITGKLVLLEVLMRCLPLISNTLTAEELIEYWFKMDARIDADVLQNCEKLRRSGTSIFLATNQDHMRADYLMNDLSLRNHVDGIIYSAGIAARKPDQAFYKEAETISGFTPEELVLIDDTKVNVKAARDAGWAAVHWEEGSNLINAFKGA